MRILFVTNYFPPHYIGGYELLLCYSPQGSGGYGPYGYATATGGREYWIELGARRW